MMETSEPRDKFNARTGRLEHWKMRDKEMDELLDHRMNVIKPKFVQDRMCPLCGEHPKNGRVLWNKEGLFYHKCNCGMVYISPILKEEIIEKYYGDSKSSQQWLQVLEAQEDLDREKFDHLLRILSHHVYDVKPRLLDVGASYGFFLSIAQSHMWNYNCVGLELSEGAIELYKERGYDDKFPLYSMKLEDYKHTPQFQKPNVMTFWEVLEHLPDPKKVLKDAHDMLEPNGVIAVLVPNLEAKTNRILHEKSKTFGANHLNYWCRQTLRQQLIEAGFHVEEDGTIIGDVNTWWNHLNFEDPYEGGLVHPMHHDETRRGLAEFEGYKLYAVARR